MPKCVLGRMGKRKTLQFCVLRPVSCAEIFEILKFFQPFVVTFDSKCRLVSKIELLIKNLGARNPVRFLVCVLFLHV